MRAWAREGGAPPPLVLFWIITFKENRNKASFVGLKV